MIKINLLPVRTSKKKETAKKELFIFAGSVVVALGAMLLLYSVTLAGIKRMKAELTESEQEIVSLKKKIGEIDNLKKLQTEVKKKLEVLNQLREGKAGPAERMMALSDAVPEKLWITAYSESGQSVKVDGIAMNEELIADFIGRLERTKQYSGVELEVSEQIEKSGMKMKKFILKCQLEQSK